MKKLNLTKLAAILFIVQSIAWMLMAFLCILCRTNVIEWHDTDGQSFKNDLEDLFYILFMEEHKSFSDVALKPDVFLVICSIIIIESLVWCILSAFILYGNQTQNLHYLRLKMAWCIIGIIITVIDVAFMAMAAQDLNYYGNLYVNNPKVIVYYMVVYGILMTVAARGFLLLVINISFHIITLKELLGDSNSAKYDD